MKSSRGQILVEIVVAVGLLTILFHAVFTLINAAFHSLGDSRARQTARYLAQSKIEEIKNLAYDQVGTQGGIPSGPLTQSETVTRNGLNYSVKRSVIFVDDPFDDLAPDDLLPTDYKRVRVEVSWSGLFSSKRPTVLVTDIAPPGMEEPVSGGTVEITVFDAQVEPVSEAQVHLVNDSVSPAIDLNLETNEDGKILLPGAPACSSCYFIEVTKQDYTSDRTYSSQEVVNPSKGYLTVEEDKVAEISFKIDKSSTLTINGPEPNLTFQLTGSKVIGTDDDENPVYKIDEEYTTGSDGRLVLEDFQWGSYKFDLLSEGYDLAGTNPLTPIALQPDSEVDFQFVVEESAENSILIEVVDTNDQPVASASARLFDDQDYEETGYTGEEEEADFGQVFFSPLDFQDYNLEVEAEDYQSDSRKVSVEDQTVERVILE